jgi:predicted nuclease of predicted toxin-antitoxin system
LKFKVDENLPTEYASILREAGFEAGTVSDEKLSGAGDSALSERCRAEDRVLMTLDLDFANVQAYPPKSHPGIVAFRSKSQDKPTSQRLLLF